MAGYLMRISGHVSLPRCGSSYVLVDDQRARIFSNQPGALGSMTLTRTEDMTEVPDISTSGASGDAVLALSRLRSKVPTIGSPSHSTLTPGGSKTVTSPMHAITSMRDVPAAIRARVRSTVTLPMTATARKSCGITQSPSRVTWDMKATVPRMLGACAAGITAWFAGGVRATKGRLGEVTVYLTKLRWPGFPIQSSKEFSEGDVSRL